MVHLHHQIADLGLELLVLGFQLAFPVRWTIDQTVVAVLTAPIVDDLPRELMFSGRLPGGQLTGLDLQDQLAFEFDIVLSTDFSHYEYRAPHPPTENDGREGLWKMTHRWKSAKNADSHTMLGKASYKTLRLSPISHSPGHDLHSTFSIRGG